MDYKKSKAPVNTVTRNIMDLCDDTGNIYESVAIIGKRANQISLQIKDDLSKKTWLWQFFVVTRNLNLLTILEYLLKRIVVRCKLCQLL